MSNQPNTQTNEEAASPAMVIMGLVIGLALIVGLVAGLYFLVTNGSNEETTTSDGPEVAAIEYGEPVDTTGTELEVLQTPGSADPAVGEQAPIISGIDTAGEPFTIGEPTTGDDAKPTMLMFLAHWCPNCQAELDELRDWGGSDEVNVVGVATAISESQPKFPPTEWLADNEWTYPTLLDDPSSTAAEYYGVSGYPFMVFLNEDGTVWYRSSGQLGVDNLEELLAGLAADEETPEGSVLG